MGDGKVALILDVLGIGQSAGVLTESREQARAASEQKSQTGIEQQRLLLFRSGSFDRLAVPLSLVARLEEFPQSVLEHAGGRQVVQYRNRILPLVPLGSVLEPGAPDRNLAADPVQVIVFNDGDRSLGVVVDQILDVVEDVVTVRQRSARKGLLGSGVVARRVTDFLDLNQVIQGAREDWFQGTGGPATGKRVVVAEASAFSRGLIRSSLDMAGYYVAEAANVDEAIHRMEQQPADVVVAALDLPRHGGAALLAALRSRPEWARIPVVALADSDRMGQSSSARQAGFSDCQARFDCQAILESVARMAAGQVPAAPAGPAVETAQACAGVER